MVNLKIDNKHGKGYSKKDDDIRKHGDIGQGEGLVDKKKKKDK